jgi:hypothetical protein
MMDMKRKILGAILLLVSVAPSNADSVDDNLQLMLGAARQLIFVTPGNRAFLLVKQETVTAPVAVIFGYGDNGVACEELALTLSTSGRVGTFKCQPIY